MSNQDFVFSDSPQSSAGMNFSSDENLPKSWLVWLQNAGLSMDDSLRISVHLETNRMAVDQVEKLTSNQLKNFGITPVQHATIVSYIHEQMSNSTLPTFGKRDESDLGLDLTEGSGVSLPDIDTLNAMMDDDTFTSTNNSSPLLGELAALAVDERDNLMTFTSDGVPLKSSTNTSSSNTSTTDGVTKRTNSTTTRRLGSMHRRSHSGGASKSTKSSVKSEPLDGDELPTRRAKKRKNESQEVQSASLIEQPRENILSGRSTHTYRLSVYRHSITELKVYMEDEHGTPMPPEFCVVENESTHTSSDGYTLVALKLRLKPDRLQLANVVFDVLLLNEDETHQDQRILRGNACIICSHITRQRAAAQKKLEKWNQTQSLGHLREKINEKYQSYRFQRRLEETEIEFLLCVALRCKREDLGAAALRDKDAARLREFDKWFGRCLKTLDRVRPYWDNESIFGFISRPDAEKMAAQHSNGVAIIRVSESVPKALAVTCKTSEGVVENKLIEHTACANCEKFVDSINNFHGGLTAVVTPKEDEVPFASAFPAVADIITSQEGRYDELIS